MVLTLELLCTEAAAFAAVESEHFEPSLYGVTDGKAVGTYLEHKFRAYLLSRGYQFVAGNSANGIDFPELLVDLKVTSVRQPQSSCPFRSARQKVYGLGYSLLIFVYDKLDNAARQTATLNMVSTVFVQAAHTADFQLTKGLRDMLANEGNRDDVVAFLSDSYLLQDEEQLDSLAKELLKHAPEQGYLNMPRKLDYWHGLISNKVIRGMPL